MAARCDECAGVRRVSKTVGQRLQGRGLRLQELLTDDDLEAFRVLNNQVIAKLSPPPRSHLDAMRRVFAQSPDADLIKGTYLGQFRPHETPFPRHQDRPIRYWNADDIVAWSDFLTPRLPRLVADARCE